MQGELSCYSLNLALSRLLNNAYEIAYSSAHKIGKCPETKQIKYLKSSYHVVVQVLVTRNQNKIYAQRL